MLRPTFARPFRTLAVLAAVALGSSSLAARDLDSYEFKLLLNSALFKGNTVEVANDVWREHLQPAIEGLDGGAVKITNAEFDKSKKRTVRYFDRAEDGDCLFHAHRITLRQRDTMKNGAVKKSKITLKFRADDLARVESLEFEGEDLKPKLEQDLLLIPKAERADKRTPKTRAIFSHSFDKELEVASPEVGPLADTMDMFIGFADELPNEPVAWQRADHLSLVSNLEVDETAFKGLKLELGRVKAKGSLTLWYFDGEAEGQPTVAEFSFSFKAKDLSDDQRKEVKGLGGDVLESISGFARKERGPKTKTALVYLYRKFCES